MIDAAPPSPERRSFLKKGLVGVALLFVGGAIPIALRGGLDRARPRGALQLFTPHEYAIFAAIAARIAPGDDAGAAWATADALDCAGKADALMAQAHPAVGTELRRLLHLFESGVTGLFTNGQPTPFTRLDPAQMDARLEAWRHSRVALLRSGYQALKRLAQATYYSSPEIYARLGYPGPPVVPMGPA
jgi:Gluconate 2-dehydrogenase subunit 3